MDSPREENADHGLRATATHLAERRRRRRAEPVARAGAQADPSAARLLLPRDVRPAGDERSDQRHLVTRRTRADLLHAGVALAAAHRLDRGVPADLRRRIRLPAGLVAGWTACRLRHVPQRRGRALASRSHERRRPRDRGARRRQRRPALVAGRLAAGVRVDVARRPLARLRRADRRRADRHSRARHGGSRQRPAALLLQRLGSLPLALVVPRRARADARLESRARVGHWRTLAHGSRARNARPRDSLRGNHVEGAARLVAGRHAGGLQQLSRPAVAPALARARQWRRRLPAHLRRLRCHCAALVT